MTTTIRVRPTTPFDRLKAENSARLRDDLSRGSTYFNGLPEVVTLNHSDICNLRCVMCPRNLAQGTHRLSRSVLTYIADDLFPTARKLVLTTSGGDPLAADYEFLLERSRMFGVAMDVVTNGILLTRDLYHESAPNVDHLNISIDSHVPSDYERIRLGAKYSRLIENLRAIQELRSSEPDDVLYSASAVVMRTNVPYLPDFVRFAHELGFEAVVFQRLQHSVKPTPDEDPERHCGAAAIERAFAESERVAREVGINLYLTEFGRPGVQDRPLRSKRPDLLLNHRMCWFMAQNFGVMYTGEVYPCCIPTDHRLGNVLVEDPIEIWNGEAAQALRKAQISGRGTVFCSGCLHAPHLAPPRLRWVNEALRVGRRFAQHSIGNLQRRLNRNPDVELVTPARPPLLILDGSFTPHPTAIATEARPDLRNDVATLAPSDGALWLFRNDTLHRTSSVDLERIRLVPMLTFERSTTTHPRATALKFVAEDIAFLAFAESGRLMRLRCSPTNAEILDELELSDPRAFVRQSAISCAPDGSIFVGEYGVFPGARCGRIYRAESASAPFTEAHRFPWARHIHAVHALRNGTVLATTGDLAARRRLLAFSSAGGPVTTLANAWSGFTAIAESASHVHFGTDLLDGNGLLRGRLLLDRKLEYRAFPAPLDLQVRDLAILDDGRLAALLSMDGDLIDRRHNRRAAILISEDEGNTWSVAFRFAADWSDAPEALLPIPDSMRRLRFLLPLFSSNPTVLRF